jgi:hypothetical protein
MGERLGRPCACGCGRTAQRERQWAWLCDPQVPAELKQQARARGGRRGLPDVPDPRFATAEGRREFREAVAGAVLRGELAAAIAAVALRACAQAEERPGKGEKPVAPLPLVEVARFAREEPA